jgi:septal ring factor EnvC (AmiA/AmiB activator)
MEAGPQKPAETPGEKPDETPSDEHPTTTLEGLRAWVAQIDRKLGTRFYALGAATVLALAAGIVAIVLVLGVKEDSATDADLDQLREDLAGVEQSASEAAEDDLAALGDRVSQLESQIQALRSDQTATDQEISVVQDDIEDLRNDISALETADASNTDASTDTDTGGGADGN